MLRLFHAGSALVEMVDRVRAGIREGQPRVGFWAWRGLSLTSPLSAASMLAVSGPDCASGAPRRSGFGPAGPVAAILNWGCQVCLGSWDSVLLGGRGSWTSGQR